MAKALERMLDMNEPAQNPLVETAPASISGDKAVIEEFQKPSPKATRIKVSELPKLEKNADLHRHCRERGIPVANRKFKATATCLKDGVKFEGVIEANDESEALAILLQTNQVKGVERFALKAVCVGE